MVWFGCSSPTDAKPSGLLWGAALQSRAVLCVLEWASRRHGHCSVKQKTRTGQHLAVAVGVGKGSRNTWIHIFSQDLSRCKKVGLIAPVRVCV